MYIQANTGRARTEQEKTEIMVKYTPGENVLPKIRKRREGSGEAEDRRMMEEVREMSLRDVGIRGIGSNERGAGHRIRDRAVGAVEEGARQRRSQDNASGERPSTASDAASQARQIEHQSSLRSLLSSSITDSSEMQEEILRQITDEGLLDGIDLNNMDVSQEDELSEKIAQAYRRRHGRRLRSREDRVEDTEHSISRTQTSGHERQHHRQGRPQYPTSQIANSHNHPPLSRPHLFEAYPTGHGNRRRTSSENRRQTSPIPPSSRRRGSLETQRQAAHSATDLSNRSESTSNQRVHSGDLPSGGRRAKDPNTPRPRGSSRDQGPSAQRSPGAQSQATTGATPLQLATTPPILSPLRSSRDPSTIGSGTAEPNIQRADPQSYSARSTDTHQAHSSVDAREFLASYAEPSISCDRCGKQNIGYELHWNCSQCHDGKYNICQRCYRIGRGCLHWYDFGYAAVYQYRNREPPGGYPQNHPLPHCLEGHRYLKPPPESLQPETAGFQLRTSSDPKKRLQSGPFCSNCSNYAPACFWKCERCNTGEWGFCNSCVNQAKCCTHALLPVTYLNPEGTSKFSPPTAAQNSGLNDIGLPATSSATVRREDLVRQEDFVPLSLSTKCVICTYPIPPSTTRFHCPHCRAGDYDIDATCYLKLVYNGKISTANGPKGWRRCPSGHRMVVVGFEDSNLGQRRIVVEDLVGGHALEDDASTDGSAEWSWREGQQRQAKKVSKASTGRITAVSADDNTPPLLKKYPPNGGIGMHILVRWSWWPQDGTTDELAFPKGAEIRECGDINGDWFWGIYCARKGLFPSNHGRVIDNVTM